ncbi:hypothetical protein I546_7169 [Mycobacterium kansasii 732]|nr:hypothetical protein I546_7169 [Mycobacterium kansasii 732]
MRAYTESFTLASAMRDDKYLYPGFRQSVDPNRSIDDPIGTQFLWPQTDGRPDPPWLGTQQDHILAVTTSGRDVTVIVCEYMFGAAEQSDQGWVRPHVARPSPYTGIAAMRITMTAPAKPGRRCPPSRGRRARRRSMFSSVGGSPATRAGISPDLESGRSGRMLSKTKIPVSRRHPPTATWYPGRNMSGRSSRPCRRLLVGPRQARTHEKGKRRSVIGSGVDHPDRVLGTRRVWVECRREGFGHNVVEC